MVMEELAYAYATAALIISYFFGQVLSKRFDPFAPIWLFLVGYTQIYVVQAISYHEWAVSVRGHAVVAAANWRALWALGWFLLVYHCGLGRVVSWALPQPPRAWSSAFVATMSPLLVLWGLFCAGITLRAETQTAGAGEPSIISNFPFVMMVAAILLIVTGRTIRGARPAFLPLGLLVSAAYVLIWMFNGKRSHSLIAVLATLSAMYITRLKRPSWPVLLSTAFAGALVVAIAIGWRNDQEHERSLAGFGAFLADFRVSRILQSINIVDADEDVVTYESEEYGGFLLMMDTVPDRSDYDYGANYLRVFSTFIPRAVWPSKPIYGRAAWINAWIAGSEQSREEDFAGPAIGLLGATQLNGGALGTLIVIGFIALLLRTCYEYFHVYSEVPWVQFWWAITYYNAWFMVVNDDPMVWFYYNWGFCVFPIVVLTWWVNRFVRMPEPEGMVPASAPAWAG
jgi:hypothetical protein